MTDIMDQLKKLQNLDLDVDKSQEIQSRMMETYIHLHSKISIIDKISQWKVFNYWEPALISMLAFSLGFDLFRLARFLSWAP